MGYTPVFSSIYSGTLYGRWPAAAVWASLLPLMDKHGQIDMSLQAICGMTGWPRDLLEQGIRQLMEPDPNSRTPDCDGRRLVLIDAARPWGWRAVNHGKYREKARLMAKDSERTESGRDADRKRQERALSPGVPRRPPVSPAVPLSDTDTDTDSKNSDRAAAQPAGDTGPDGFAEVRARFPRRAGSHRWQDAEKHYRARLREGATPAEILAGVDRYAAFIRASGKERTEYVQQAATFLGTNRGYLEPWTEPAKPESDYDRLIRLNGGSPNQREVIEHDAIPIRIEG